MRLLDVLGQRWVLRILWVLRDGPMSFRSLQAACEGISPAVLNDRLKLLRAHDLLALGPDGNGWTDRARALAPMLAALGQLADAWAGAGDWPRAD